MGKGADTLNDCLELTGGFVPKGLTPNSVKGHSPLSDDSFLKAGGFYDVFPKPHHWMITTVNGRFDFTALSMKDLTVVLSSGVGSMTVIDLIDDFRRSEMKPSLVMTSTFDFIMIQSLSHKSPDHRRNPTRDTICGIYKF